MILLDNDPEIERAANQRRIDAADERRARGRARSQSVQAHNIGGPAKPTILPDDPKGIYVDASFDDAYKVGVAIAVAIDNDRNILDSLEWRGAFVSSGDAEVAAIHLGLLLVKRKKLEVPLYTDYEGAVDAFRPAGKVIWLPRTYMGIPHGRASRGLHKMVKQLQNRQRAGR